MDLVFLFVAIVIGIVIHEMMHGVVAYWLGDRTAADAGRLTLNPLASVDPLTTILMPFVLIVTLGVPFFAAKPVPFNPDQVKWGEYGAALVGLAGPATNFVLAVIGAGLFHLTGDSGLLHSFAYYFTLVNIGIMVFNLIPFPPLDGSRVLYAFAPEPLQRVMARIESFGFVALLIFILVLFQFLAPVVSDVQRTILQFLLSQPVY
jgi:Zn-dependent protease